MERAATHDAWARLWTAAAAASLVALGLLLGLTDAFDRGRGVFGAYALAALAVVASVLAVNERARRRRAEEEQGHAVVRR